MMYLRLPDGSVTAGPSEMRKLAIAFHTSPFSAGSCDPDAGAELLEGLPRLDEALAASLESTITLDEASAVVQQLNCGWSSGIDGLPSEFYKHFGTLLGKDLF